MTRDELVRRLALAADEAIVFARTCVVDTIPNARLFDIAVIPHHDGRVDPPLDDLYRRSRRGVLADVDPERAVTELWHDGKVPEWIDISVKEVGHPPDDAWALVTFVELRCSRTIAPDDALWYAGTGNAPFHVLGPSIPRAFLERHTEADGTFDPKGARFMLERHGRGRRRR